MKFLKRIFSSILNWFLNKPEVQFHFCDDLPLKKKSNFIYIIGESKNYWLLAFKCPCGCNEDILLNLLEDASPCWDYKIFKGAISITPSIWRVKGCKSHFIIKEGSVCWVK